MLADLTQAEQTVLVDVLVASVRQASEGPVLAGRSGAKKVSGRNETETALLEHTRNGDSGLLYNITWVLNVVGDERQRKENSD